MPEQSNDYRVVVFGAGGVGKSSLVLRFVKGTFRESYIPTVEDTYRQVSARSSHLHESDGNVFEGGVRNVDFLETGQSEMLGDGNKGKADARTIDLNTAAARAWREE